MSNSRDALEALGVQHFGALPEEWWDRWEARHADKPDEAREFRTRMVRQAVNLSTWKRIKSRDGHMCLKCGTMGRDLEVDHVKAVFNGGTSADDNLQTLCKACNSEKWIRTEDARGRKYPKKEPAEPPPA